jgi:hypothetical protein
MRESEAVSAVARVDCVLGIEIENGNHDGCPCVPGNLGAGRPEGRWQAISSLRAASCRFVPLRAASCRFVPLRAASCRFVSFVVHPGTSIHLGSPRRNEGARRGGGLDGDGVYDDSRQPGRSALRMVPEEFSDGDETCLTAEMAGMGMPRRGKVLVVQPPGH